jgi:N-acetyl sugar amidotransferase
MEPSQLRVSSEEERDLEQTVIAREAARQAKARWPAGFESAAARPYQMCARTVMDTTDPEIRFDSAGVCHWVHDYEREVAREMLPLDQRERELARVVDMLKASGKGRQHDCVVGLSGGVDSSYICLLAKELGLRPLVVHFDNGWNSELAVKNIEHIVRKLDFELFTLVMDWPEFRDLQRSYFKASVVDLEVPSDHMIFASMSKVASEHSIRHVISGTNRQTEWLLPRSWYYSKQDLTNLKNIHARFGTRPLKHLPKLGLVQQAYYAQVRGIETVEMLELVNYDKPAAKRRLISELGWRDYGGKHHESVFTRFYQGYILPRKFNIDKRKAHLSNLILAGQVTRSEALRELLSPPYDPKLQEEDFTFVAKKLGFSEAELHQVLEQPNRSHQEYGTDEKMREAYYGALKRIDRFKPVLRAARGALHSLTR